MLRSLQIEIDDAKETNEFKVIQKVGPFNRTIQIPYYLEIPDQWKHN